MIKTKYGKEYAKQLEKLDKESLIDIIFFQEEVANLMGKTAEMFTRAIKGVKQKKDGN